MTDLARLLLGLLPALAPTGAWDTGIATMMLRGHAASGGPAACARHGLVRRILPKDRHIRDDFALAALRNRNRYPCGSYAEVILFRTGRRTTVLVVDAGPAGVRCNGRRRLATRDEINRGILPTGCKWNALIDLTTAAHAALGGDGYEYVGVRPLRDARRSSHEKSFLLTSLRVRRPPSKD